MAIRTRVKICGITRVEDALLAQSLGVDALGFVFVAASRRHVTPRSASRIIDRLSGFTVPIGLFLDAPAHEVRAAITVIPHLVPQFHGREAPDYCEQFDRPYIKALGMADGIPDEALLERFPGARGFLLDSHSAGELGGTGQRFDWSMLATCRPRSLVLAGGLHAGNVEQAIRLVRPYAVDVSSGVEHAPGVKDPALMRSFVSAVMLADNSHRAGHALTHPDEDTREQ